MWIIRSCLSKFFCERKKKKIFSLIKLCAWEIDALSIYSKALIIFFCDDFNYKWYYMKNWQSWKIEFLNLLLSVFIHRTSFMCDFHYGTCRNYITLLCTYCSCPNSESLCSCTDLQSLHTSHQLFTHTCRSFTVIC